jgi:hypothetical protein
MLDFDAPADSDELPAAIISTAAAAPPPPRTDAEIVAEATSGKLGLVPVSLSGRPHPLWLRAGTADAEAVLASLAIKETGLNLPYEPRRILEIGAGTGLRTVALALLYPGTEILSTESDPACQRAGMLNTLPFRTISAAYTAVSTSAGRYGFVGRGGEAGRPVLQAQEQGPIIAQSLTSFLTARAWGGFDTVIITPDAASDHLLRAAWPAGVRLIAVQNGAQPLHEATASCFPAEHYLTEYEGEYTLLYRRVVTPVNAPPRPSPVFNPDGFLHRITLENVPAGAFFPFSPHGFRLHANSSPSPAATLTVPHICHDNTELHLSMRNPLDVAGPIRFTARVLNAADDGEICSISEVVKPGATKPAIARFARHTGPVRVIFTTEMAEFGAGNAGAWAEFVIATFA